MKIGIISDIHANYEALKSSYKAIEKAGVDKIVCIGDIVGYGAKPRECIDFIREHGIESVRGNHDYYTAREEPPKDIQPYAAEVINWTKNILDPEHVEYLGALPFIIEGDNHVFVHSSLEALDGAYWPYILDSFLSSGYKVRFFRTYPHPFVFYL
jgi:predicted phosphodiesterase